MHDLAAMYPVRGVFSEARGPPLQRRGIDMAGLCRSLDEDL